MEAKQKIFECKMESNIFSIKDRVVIITGGGGLMGEQHAIAVFKHGGIPIICDVDKKRADQVAEKIGKPALAIETDIADEKSIHQLLDEVVSQFGRIDLLINNAARNPKVENGQLSKENGILEDLDLCSWELDIKIGLTGAMLCSKIIGAQMAKQGKGVILNIASDLAIIAPDQRLYRDEKLQEHEQVKKPLSYSVVKSGLVGLTKYLATYWPDKGVRANALCPGGIENGQPAEFLEKIKKLIPMQRMANRDEYQGAVIFLISDASKYMTGQTLVMDGGRSIW
jgi:NAD(P)-dependent dehydrogenase (short-subunit alcohol dehydrogenase family)